MDTGAPVLGVEGGKQAGLTFEWSSLSEALLRSFLFFDYDDAKFGSNLGKKEVEDMRLAEVVERIEHYDRNIDMTNDGRRSWADDLLETLREEENDGAFGTTLV